MDPKLSLALYWDALCMLYMTGTLGDHAHGMLHLTASKLHCMPFLHIQYACHAAQSQTHALPKLLQILLQQLTICLAVAVS